MEERDTLVVEELEARFELASVMAEEEADTGCCSGSCCLVGGNCTPSSGGESTA